MTQSVILPRNPWVTTVTPAPQAQRHEVAAAAKQNRRNKVFNFRNAIARISGWEVRRIADAPRKHPRKNFRTALRMSEKFWFSTCVTEFGFEFGDGGEIGFAGPHQEQAKRLTRVAGN